jgi:D-alanyl-D-alanine carboxypeptidase
VPICVHKVWSRARLHLVLLAAIAGVASCSSGPSSGSGSTTTTGSSSTSASADAGNPEPCVADVSQVVATKPAAASTSSPLPAPLVSSLDAAAASAFKAAATPGAIVGVRTPQGTWIKAYGSADPATKAPMTTDMHMRIGSVTKTFTGTLILQLAQEGKLSLDDPIEKYVSGIPNGNKITLVMLADMTSGIASYYTQPFLDKYFGNPETIFTPDQLIAYGVPESPIFAPGDKFNYSNTNTILLGKVVEKVTGQSFGDVLQSQILNRLRLFNTSGFPDTSPAIPDPHPQGYTLQGSGTPDHPANATNWNPSFGWAAGAMISTVSDMLIYDRALGTGQGILSGAMQTRRLESFPKPAGYGLGIACSGGWVGHTGELPGFNATVFYQTASDTSVVVLVNSDIASGNCPKSPTLTDNPGQLPCSSPATRMFVGVSKALGYEFVPPPQN